MGTDENADGCGRGANGGERQKLVGHVREWIQTTQQTGNKFYAGVLKILTHRQTSKANAIHSNRLFIIVAIPAHREEHKDEIKNVANTVEWKAHYFLQNRVEAIVLD
jgi:hypothetical protein